MAAVYKAISKPEAKKDLVKANGTTKETRQRLLMLTSRGVTYRRKEAKLDTKTKLYQLNELAELYNCNNVLFFEARKGKDLYAWMSKPPNGPTIKFHLQNLHTMDELHFTGNCLKGSRPILSFDAAFDQEPHLQVIKEVLLHSFGVPKSSRKLKPFIDHVMGFTIANGRIWIRCYQITETEADKHKAVPEGDVPVEETSENKGDTSISLIEIGPRFVLTPIVILESSFGGPVIYENKEFVSPNQVRSELRKSRASRYNNRAEAQFQSKNKRGDMGLTTHGGRKTAPNPLDNTVLFK